MTTHGHTHAMALGLVTVVTFLALGCAAPNETQPSEPAAADAEPVAADASETPSFRVDPFWPGELPNNWILGQVSGLSVDAQDHVWIVHRRRTLDARQRGEEGMCCVPAPHVIEFSPDGEVLRSWGGPGEGFEWPENEHGIHVDHEGHVWIGGNGASDAHVLKFTSDGEFLLQIGRAGQSGGSNDTENLGRPASIEVDAGTNEVYIADGYGNRRVVVYDAVTGEYKRHWGAYGDRPDDVALPAYDPEAEPSRHFRSPVHGATIAVDGLVYVADRANNRVQVFQKDGAFVTEAFIRSRDPRERYGVRRDPVDGRRSAVAVRPRWDQQRRLDSRPRDADGRRSFRTTREDGGAVLSSAQPGHRLARQPLHDGGQRRTAGAEVRSGRRVTASTAIGVSATAD